MTTLLDISCDLIELVERLESLQQGEQVPGASLTKRGSYIRIS